jgi:hypothetical protein
MTTAYTNKATIATPAAHVPDANQLALALGESSADDQTFTTASYQDASGNLYAVCSTVAKTIFAQLAGQPLKAPDHALDMDLAAATRAQALLQINGGTAGPDVIVVILGDRLESAQDHIAALGLTRVEQDDTPT